jgi:hypothetical protein
MTCRAWCATRFEAGSFRRRADWTVPAGLFQLLREKGIISSPKGVRPLLRSFKVFPNGARNVSAQGSLIMTTSRLFDEHGAIRRLSLSGRHAFQSSPCRRALGEGAGPGGAKFYRRTQGTIVAPMTFTRAEALSDSAAVADEHFLFDSWHYHRPFWSRLRADGVARSTHGDANRGELQLQCMASRPDGLLSKALLVDDELRYSSSVEGTAFL